MHRCITLRYEDFLEAVVRVALIKALPTEEQIYDADCEDAGEFLLRLRANPNAYTTWLEENTRAWDAPPPEPVPRRVDGVCALLVRTVLAVLEKAKAGAVGHGIGVGTAPSERRAQSPTRMNAVPKLDEKMVKHFRQFRANFRN